MVCVSEFAWLAWCVYVSFLLWLGRFFLMLARFRILLQGLSRMPGQLSLFCPLLRSKDRAVLLVSFPEDGIVQAGLEAWTFAVEFCRAMLVLLRLLCCVGRKVHLWRRTVRASDVDDVYCVHVPVRQACSVCVSGSTACALECWDLDVRSSLCPWCNL